MIRKHIMLKDIYDQPRVMKACIERNLSKSLLMAKKIANNNYSKIFIIGCSTTGYIGIACKPVFENIDGMPVENIPASEFTDYPPQCRNSLLIAVSRSGETGDILSALNTAKKKGIDTLAIVEVPKSTLAKKADDCLYTYAGKEGMVSIKSYTNGIATLCLLALQLAGVRKTRTPAQMAPLFRQIKNYPKEIQKIIKAIKPQIDSLAEKYKNVKYICLLAKGPNYATALEGMLMIKEASLTRSEAIYGGDLKHGHINVVGRDTLAIFLSSPGIKMLDMIEDVKKAGGKVIVIGRKDDNKLKKKADDYIGISTMADEFFSPVPYTVPLQLLAYYLAIKKGVDPDHGAGSEMVGGFYKIGKRMVYSIKKR